MHWPEHARYCYIYAAELFNPSVPFSKRGSSLRRNWWMTYRRAGSRRLPPSVPLLHMVCHLGIVPWTRAIVEKKRWRANFYGSLDKKGITGRTALSYAAEEGHDR
jgi:hypothetical protein